MSVNNLIHLKSDVLRLLSGVAFFVAKNQKTTKKITKNIKN